MSLKRHLTTLWNGGLEPNTASPDRLRERRMISTTIFVLVPIGFLVMSINMFRGLSGDNPIIAGGIVFVLFALIAQAKWSAPKFAANMAISGFWAILALIMQTSGIFGQTWIWLFSLPAIATLLGGLRSGIFWSAVSTLTVWAFAGMQLSNMLELDAQVQVLDSSYAIGLAVEGTLVLLVLCGTLLIFKNLQNSAENRLKETVASLEKEIDSRMQAEQKALSSERAKSAFLAAMSHELRTPMNGVLGAIRLMQESTEDHEKSEYAGIAEDSGELLLELINNIMDLSSLESGTVAIEKIPVDLSTLIHKTMAPFKYQADNKNLELIIDIDESTPNSIMGDPTRLRQVIINLVGNALKFTQSGEIRIRLEYSSQCLKIEVSDTGIGIAEDAQAALFEPYVQAGVSTNREFGGSGLGLSIVKSLVTHMQGSIKLHSVEGYGTKLVVSLPCDICALQANELGCDIELATPSLRILVADDNAVNRMVLSRLLEKDKHNVVTVTNGQEALDYVDNHSLDVILMDIQMPELDGIAATKYVRKMNCEKAKIPIIAITANTNPKEIERMLAAGMNGYFAKPFKYEDIQKSLSATGLSALENH